MYKSPFWLILRQNQNPTREDFFFCKFSRFSGNPVATCLSNDFRNKNYFLMSMVFALQVCILFFFVDQIDNAACPACDSIMMNERKLTGNDPNMLSDKPMTKGKLLALFDRPHSLKQNVVCDQITAESTYFTMPTVNKPSGEASRPDYSQYGKEQSTTTKP